MAQLQAQPMPEGPGQNALFAVARWQSDLAAGITM
jgi:hypothetical protein